MFYIPWGLRVAQDWQLQWAGGSMKAFYFGIIITILTAHQAMASSVYINNNQLTAAIQALYPGEPNARFGGSCTSCHMDNNGGAGTIINQFGIDFVQGGGSSGLPQAQLEAAFIAISLMDSDGDQEDNETEFINGTDPGNSNSNSSGGSGGGGGGSVNTDDFNFEQPFADDNAEARTTSSCGTEEMESSAIEAGIPLSGVFFFLLLGLPILVSAGVRRRFRNNTH